MNISEKFIYIFHLNLFIEIPTALHNSLNLKQELLAGADDLPVHVSHTVSVAGNPCWQNRISTCTVSISESVDSLLLTPVTGARRQQQSLLAQCAQLIATE
jgi:hypothetical protein